MADERIDIDLRPDRVVLSMDVRVGTDDKASLAPVGDYRYRWLETLKRYSGQVLRVVVHAPRKRRTLPQNAYLWAVVYSTILDGMRKHCFEAGLRCPFANEEDVHLWAKYRFLRREHVLPGGELIEFPPSTTLLDTGQMSDYVELLCAWAAEPPRGIYVPSPADYWSKSA